jgi:hypothetical protein
MRAVAHHIVKDHDDLKSFIESIPTSTGLDFDGHTMRPLAWWCHSEHRTAYPRLSRMANDIFSIAPFSDEPERVFQELGGPSAGIDIVY